MGTAVEAPCRYHAARESNILSTYNGASIAESNAVKVARKHCYKQNVTFSRKLPKQLILS